MHRSRLYLGLLQLGLLLTTLAASAAGQSNLVDPRSIAPYVPAPWDVVDRMLSMADVTDKDVVYDLGSGDGRFLIRAAKNFGAHAVGLEINHNLVEETERGIEAAGVEGLASIQEKNIFDADLSPATVVTIHVMASSYGQLKPKLELELKPGTRVVSYRAMIPGWTHVKHQVVKASGVDRDIYLYVLGKH